jgi:hypothetical protein
MARRIMSAREYAELLEPFQRHAISDPTQFQQDFGQDLLSGEMMDEQQLRYMDYYRRWHDMGLNEKGQYQQRTQPNQWATFPEGPQGPKVMVDAGRTAVADPDAQWGADAMRSITNQEYPGITVHDNVGDAPGSGYMVSRPGYEQDQSYSRLQPQDIRDYVTKNQDVLAHPDNYYGGWEEDGRWYHDISRNITDPEEATLDAIDGGQQAVYDLNQDKPVWTHEMLDQIRSPGIAPGLMLGSRDDALYW